MTKGINNQTTKPKLRLIRRPLTTSQILKLGKELNELEIGVLYEI